MTLHALKSSFLRKLLPFALFLAALIVVLTLQAETQKGLLWEISGAELKTPSYLFGTIHTDHPSVMKLPAEVQEAFSKSRSFSGEIIFDYETSLRLLELMKLPAGTSLENLLDKATYTKVKKITAELGVSEQQLLGLYPWAVAVTMSIPKRESEIYLDTRLFADAVNMGKPVFALETIDEQLRAFVNMNMDDQVTLLRETTSQYHLFDEMFEQLLALYLKRDLTALQLLEDEHSSQSDQRIQKYLRDELMIKRNHRMLEGIRERIKAGNAFIAVGALHLPGDEGLLNLLKQEGYKVKAIY